MNETQPIDNPCRFLSGSHIDTVEKTHDENYRERIYPVFDTPYRTYETYSSEVIDSISFYSPGHPYCTDSRKIYVHPEDTITVLRDNVVTDIQGKELSEGDSIGMKVRYYPHSERPLLPEDIIVEEWKLGFLLSVYLLSGKIVKEDIVFSIPAHYGAAVNIVVDTLEQFSEYYDDTISVDYDEEGHAKITISRNSYVGILCQKFVSQYHHNGYINTEILIADENYIYGLACGFLSMGVLEINDDDSHIILDYSRRDLMFISHILYQVGVTPYFYEDTIYIDKSTYYNSLMIDVIASLTMRKSSITLNSNTGIQKRGKYHFYPIENISDVQKNHLVTYHF